MFLACFAELVNLTNLRADNIDKSDQTFLGVFAVTFLVEITDIIGWCIACFNEPAATHSTDFDTQVSRGHGRNIWFKR